MVMDFHSHILPGIDDGSDSLTSSIAMLRMEAEQGIRRVAATPHFYPNHDSPERFLRRRREAELRLREELEKYPGLPEILVGAEVYFFPGMSDSDILPELTLAGSDLLLLEMPQAPWTEAMYREMEGIRDKQGITPLIAHVDRYIRPFRTHGIPERLTEMPVLVQANASFFLRSQTRSMALRMLKKGQIHLLGSDCHDPVNRPPRLGEAVERIRTSLGDSAIRRILQAQELALGANASACK